MVLALVVIDHNLLTSIKDVGGRLARWFLYLQQFNFTLEDRSGKQHGNADEMSHLCPANPVLGVFQPLFPNEDIIKTAQYAFTCDLCSC